MDVLCRWCDWCGKPAYKTTRRTLYANTEYEMNSSYYECEDCAKLSTKELEKNMEDTLVFHWEETHKNSYQTKDKHFFVRRMFNCIKQMLFKNKTPF